MSVAEVSRSENDRVDRLLRRKRFELSSSHDFRRQFVNVGVGLELRKESFGNDTSYRERAPLGELLDRGKCRDDWLLAFDDALHRSKDIVDGGIGALLRATKQFVDFNGELTQLTVGDREFHRDLRRNSFELFKLTREGFATAENTLL